MIGSAASFGFFMGNFFIKYWNEPKFNSFDYIAIGSVVRSENRLPFNNNMNVPVLIQQRQPFKRND
jgi:hypothetical protein